ncbi:hypothetical protein DICPUDRAFT_150906 [Dictyostelium purpureum]|uniref:Uncharacterized protein n=1 Tax=Dictyostelium purpureum TaxID=5786 RepID=F0ZHJ6_DICPU|nr:uncharacterized protein DICPUDRAFT_150906 [Dictyostelium purpureum]EGC36581.1 hypothetical protein DICPUDRAFT_150906 [Dictyostelium purpureum]|eukprot:XP_003286885.1 hypothetical protein DICPUDRAFT_150906 [Dictyostelium purpureum]
MSTNNNQNDGDSNMDTNDCIGPSQNNQHYTQNPFSPPKNQNYKNENNHPNSSYKSNTSFQNFILKNIIKNNEPILFFEPPTTPHHNITTLIQNYTSASKVNQTKDKIIATFTNYLSRNIFLKNHSEQNIIKINIEKEILELKFTIPEPFGLQPNNISLYIDFDAILSQSLFKKINTTTFKLITTINNIQTDKFDQSVIINHLSLKFNSCLERSLFLFHNNCQINTSSSDLPYYKSITIPKKEFQLSYGVSTPQHNNMDLILPLFNKITTIIPNSNCDRFFTKNNNHYFTLRSTYLNLGPSLKNLKQNTINLEECTIKIESIIYTIDQHVLLNKFSIYNKTIDPRKHIKLDLWLSHVGTIKLNDEIISLISSDPATNIKPTIIPITLLTTNEINKLFEKECSPLLKSLINQIQSQPQSKFRANIICNYTDIEDFLHIVKCSTYTNNKISDLIVEYFNLLKKFNKKSKHDIKDFDIIMQYEQSNNNQNKKRYRTNNNGRE